MKKLIVMLIAMLFISCAMTQTDFTCPRDAQSKLILKIQSIPVKEWVVLHYADLIITRRGKASIEISKKGNLFVDSHYIHIPWEYKLQFQKLYQRIFCCIKNSHPTYFEKLLKLFKEE